jgi:mono/diheme cytochrome c family protein
MCGPIFQKHCYDCHGEKKQKSGLRLNIKSEAFKGGDNHAPDIIAKNAKDSPLIHFITTDDEDELMPPKGKLSSSEIETLTAWINEGAVWPDGVDLAKLEDRRDHWSFKPLTKSASTSKFHGFIHHQELQT